MATVTVEPDDRVIYGSVTGPNAVSTTGSLGDLSDNSDATYARAHASNSSGTYNSLGCFFTVPTGIGGVDASQVVPRLRIKLNDDGADGDTRLQIYMYATTGSSPLFVQWSASLPDHSVIYDEGLPLDASLVLGTNHWWAFDSFGGPTDPWPEATTQLAAGNLTFEISRNVNNQTVRPWTEGDAFVYEFTLTVPTVDLSGGIPPRRIFGRTDGKTHGAPRLFGNR